MSVSTPPEPTATAAYDFVAPSTILFGPGRLSELGTVSARLGGTAWIVAGRRSLARCGGRSVVESLLRDAGLEATWIATAGGEPTVTDVADALRGLPARGELGPVVIAIGGGATIDLAKAVAALATNADPGAADVEQEVINHLEGMGRGLSIRVAPLPVVAVPTTAGTGAEATRNAVISCPRRRFKKSMRSPLMVPRAALVDPALTVSCDRGVTAASGLDCVTQLIESFICRFRAPLPRALVLDALPRALASLPRVLAFPADLDARAAMSHAALVSGMALTNSGLGMAHGVAAALGVECGTPHGLACALMLPVALRVNRPACRDDLALLERAVDSGASSSAEEAADAFIARIETLCDLAGTPRRLADVGLDRDRIGWLAENSGGASMRGNPVDLSPNALCEILARAW
ncbi:MAG: iron-containing alcohol dehydrogenase [Planctomycetia bacterium]|nr:iron-containing alcohol dehydrogenase [Planctomycetia bacterium]